jgi:microcystin-dependent protein
MTDAIDLLAEATADDNGGGRTVNGTVVSRSGDVVKVDIGGETLDAYSSAVAGVPVDATVVVSIQQGTASVTGVIDGPSGAVPVGALMMWATGTAPPGWLICNGGSFSGTDYPALQSVLGSTTLPDLRDRFPIGTSGTKAVKSTGGAASITQTAAQMPTHNHNLVHTHPTGMAIGTIQEGTSGSFPSIMYPTAGGTNTGGASTAITSSNGNGDPMNILNPYYSVNFIIYAGAVAA